MEGERDGGTEGERGRGREREAYQINTEEYRETACVSSDSLISHTVYVCYGSIDPDPIPGPARYMYIYSIFDIQGCGPHKAGLALCKITQ